MLKNCQECNRVFAHPSRRLCDTCYEELQKHYTEVRDYLQKNPGASVVEVSTETGVHIDTIHDFIQEGRLHIIPHDVEFKCEVCGDVISTGRVCSKCRNQFRKSSYTPPEEKEPSAASKSGTRVHFLDQIKDRR